MNIFLLDGNDNFDMSSIVRHNLFNLLSAYADEADVFTETIQNAYDAIQKAISENLYTNGDKPEITIVIGRRSNGHHYIYIGDNGIGMEPDIANRVAVQGFSYNKEKGKTVGYKGVGASYFFATSQVSGLRTISSTGVKSEFFIRGAYSWISDANSPEPRKEDTFNVPECIDEVTSFSRGTGVYFEFHEAMRPSSLSNIVVIGNGAEQELDNWVSYLAGKTVLGSVDNLTQLGIKINLHLDTGDGIEFSKTWMLGEYEPAYSTVGYPFPYKVIGHNKNIDELIKLSEGKKQEHVNRYQAISKRWTADEIVSEIKFDERQVEKLREKLLWVEGYLCSSTSVLKEINKILGGRHQIIRHGIRLVSDGVPQGRMIDLSLTSSQGLDRQSHIVIAFKGLEFDPGRKICADEDLAAAIPEIGKRAVGILKDFRWAFKKEDRPDPVSELSAWAADIESRSEDSTVRELYDICGLPRVLDVDPASENEVIALFVSLMSNGLIKGYKIRSISGFKRYDSLVNIEEFSEELKNVKDVLAIRSNGVDCGHNKVLEFKYNFDALLSDFADKVKNPKEIDVLVCWKVPSINVSRGRLEPTYGRWSAERPLYGASYVWVDDNESARIPVICLRNVVLELLKKKELEKHEPGLGVAALKKLETRDYQASI